jgi:hypothetical protein
MRILSVVVRRLGVDAVEPGKNSINLAHVCRLKTHRRLLLRTADRRSSKRSTEQN